jgi:hypothetical protein
MRFRYLRDPLFLAAFCLYGFNRFVIKPCTEIRFFHESFNDLICIPLFVPIVVLVARKCGLRNHDRPPETTEIVLPLIVWSIMFELLFPKDPFWSRWVTGDPYDVLWYCVGALVASLWWRRLGRRPTNIQRKRPLSPMTAGVHKSG